MPENAAAPLDTHPADSIMFMIDPPTPTAAYIAAEAAHTAAVDAWQTARRAYNARPTDRNFAAADKLRHATRYTWRCLFDAALAIA